MNAFTSAPRSLRLMHDQVRNEFERAAGAGNRIAIEAQQLAEMCLPHFEDEERYVFPLLGVLPNLGQGLLHKDILRILPLLDELRERHEAVEKDHQLVQLGIMTLMEACQEEKNKEIGKFAYSLRVHEKLEDEVIYPTVLLLGDYLRERVQVPGLIGFPLDLVLPGQPAPMTALQGRPF